MKETLQKYGFTMKSCCSCGGTYKETWKKQTPKGMFNVSSMPKKGIFNIKLNDVTIVKNTKADELEAKLIEII